jgi:hypothetical protein
VGVGIWEGGLVVAEQCRKRPAHRGTPLLRSATWSSSALEVSAGAGGQDRLIEPLDGGLRSVGVEVAGPDLRHAPHR